MCTYTNVFVTHVYRVIIGGLSHRLTRPHLSAGSTHTSSLTLPPIRPYCSSIQHYPLSAQPHPIRRWWERVVVRIRVVPLRSCLGMRCRICSRCQVTKSASPGHWLDGGWRLLRLTNCVDNRLALQII